MRSSRIFHRHQHVFFIGNSHYNYSEGLLINGKRMPKTCYDTLRGYATKPLVLVSLGVGGRTINDLINTFSVEVLPYLREGDIVSINEFANQFGLAGVDGTTAGALAKLQQLTALISPITTNIIMNSSLPNGTGTNETEKLACDAAVRVNPSTYGCVSFCDFRSVAGYQTPTDATNSTNFESDQKHLKNVSSDLLGSGILATTLRPYLQT